MICVGDTGTNIDISVQDADGTAVTLAGPNTATMILEFESGRRSTHTATITGGLARYTTVAGDIPNDVGKLRIQLDLVIGAWDGCSTVFETEVIEAI